MNARAPRSSTSGSAATPVLAGAALVVALGALGVALTAPPAPTAGPDRVASGAPGPDAALLARIDALEAANRDLRDRLELLGTAGADTDRAPVVDAVTRAELDARLDQLRGELDDAATDRAPSESVYERMWKDSKARSEADERDRDDRAIVAEKLEAQREADLEVLEVRMMKFEDQLGLDRRSSDALRGALLTHFEREAEWARRWAAGEDVSELKASDTAALQAELEQILTPDQLEQYHAMNGGTPKVVSGGGAKGGDGGSGAPTPMF